MSSTYELFMSDSIYEWSNNKEVKKYLLDIVFSYPQLRSDNVLHKWEYYSPYNFPSDKFLYEYCYGQLFFIRSLFHTYTKYTKTSNVALSSAILSKITDITNKYLSDKRTYIPGITPRLYYYLSIGNSKSIRELCYFIKLILDSEKSQFSYNPYTPEYTVQNYKSDMKNLYKAMISQKILNSYITQNNSTKQRSNNQEEMSCLKLITDRNNTNKKFHK